MCDFQVRVLGNTHRYSLQCLIWINMLNEKLYLFLWWWFLLVAIFSIIDLFYWLAALFLPGSSASFIRRYLSARHTNTAQPINEYAVRTFVSRNLRIDGVLILRVMSTNVGDLMTTYVIEKLWDTYNPSPPPTAPFKGTIGDETHALIDTDNGGISRLPPDYEENPLRKHE